MDASAPGPPLASGRPLAPLRETLTASGFAGPAIRDLLGTDGTLLASSRRLPVHRRRALAGDGPLGALVLLLVLGLELDADEAERRLGTETLGLLEAPGLVAAAGDAVRPRCRLVPHDEILVASDLTAPGAAGILGEGGALHVPGVQAPSSLLARLTVRRPVASALDVGTGCGIQAILASRHAERVVATDVNERALAYAAFNLALNDVGNAELRQGSFLEPVEGERFDLVVSNPPYVVSPETAYAFRDAGLGRDRVSESLVRALPSALAEGGFASALVSWIVEGDDELEAPRCWAEATGCAAWLVHTASHDALAAAEGWNRHLADRDELDATLEAWLSYYAAEGIGALAYGCLVLRREAPAWFRAAELPDGGTPAAGEHLLRLFANGDAVDAAGEDGLLDLRPRIVPEAAIVSRAEPAGEGWRTAEAELELRRGLGFRAGLDAYASALVTRLDGSLTLRDAIAAAADATGSDPAVFAAPAVAVARSLLEHGFAETA